MLKEQCENKDTVGANEESNDEETYQRMFKKIARDFVCKEDLDNILGELLEKIIQKKEDENLTSSEINSGSIGAVMKAIEYKSNLSLPKHKRRKYKDVLDDDNWWIKNFAPTNKRVN